MKNIAFVIWMIGAPIGKSLSQYVNEYLCKHIYSDIVIGLVAFIGLVVYIFIGYKLYEKKS
ncbi:MAG: hypothetical protein V1910_03180 [bacterium]